MRILQVIETGGPGGAETVFARLASGLLDRGHAVHCATGRGSWLPAELERRGFAPTLLDHRGAFDHRLLAQLRRLIRDHRIDIVHAHLFDGSVYASLAARLEGVPCVVTLHGQVDLKGQNLRDTAKRWALRLFASRIVAVSQSLRGEISTALGISRDHVTVIYNGSPEVEPANGSPASSFPELRRLVAVGNIRQPKGYPILLDAVALLRSRGLSVQLTIAGEPDRDGLQRSLEQQSANLGIADMVTFGGFVADPSPLLRAADCFVLASTKEGFSLATIEAMQVGTPVVATRSGGPEEIIVHGSTGLLVAPGDSRALAIAIEDVLRAPAQAQERANAAREDVSRRFSLAAMVDQYLSLYSTLTGPSPD